MFKGSVIAQVIALIASVVLAKIYGASAYGVFGTFISVAGIISVVNTFQLENIIVLSKDIKNSINWRNFLIIFTPTITLITFLAGYFLITSSIINYNVFLLLITLLCAIFLSYNKIFEAFFTALNKFNFIANGKVLFTLLNVTFQYLLYSRYKLMGLVYGFIVSSFCLLIFYLLKNKYKSKKIEKWQLKEDILNNKGLITYLLPSSTLNIVALNIMPILILTYFSAKDAGEYFLSTKILFAPLALIAGSVTQVFFKKTVDLYSTKKEELYRLSKKIVSINVLIMFVFVILLNTIGVYFLEMYMEKDWANLKLFILILSFLALARVSFNPISSLTVVLNKNHISLLFNIYIFIVNLIAIYLGFVYKNILITISITSFFCGIGYLYLLGYFLIILKRLQNAE